MAKAYVITESDRAAIQRLIDTVRRLRLPTHPDFVEDDHQAPEVYIARTPASGIPVNSPHAGVLTGTSTTAESLEDVPGYAECDIYAIVEDETAPYLISVGISQRVYNLSTIPVYGAQWVVIARDKSGAWHVVKCKTGESMVVKILSGPDALNRYEAWAEEWSENERAWLVHYSILAREMNGREPVQTERYPGIFADVSENDVPIYQIRADCPCPGAGPGETTGTGSGGGDVVIVDCEECHELQSTYCVEITYSELACLPVGFKFPVNYIGKGTSIPGLSSYHVWRGILELSCPTACPGIWDGSISAFYLCYRCETGFRNDPSSFAEAGISSDPDAGGAWNGDYTCDPIDTNGWLYRFCNGTAIGNVRIHITGDMTNCTGVPGTGTGTSTTSCGGVVTYAADGTFVACNSSVTAECWGGGGGGANGAIASGGGGGGGGGYGKRVIAVTPGNSYPVTVGAGGASGGGTGGTSSFTGDSTSASGIGGAGGTLPAGGAGGGGTGSTTHTGGTGGTPAAGSGGGGGEGSGASSNGNNAVGAAGGTGVNDGGDGGPGGSTGNPGTNGNAPGGGGGGGGLGAANPAGGVGAIGQVRLTW